MATSWAVHMRVRNLVAFASVAAAGMWIFGGGRAAIVDFDVVSTCPFPVRVMMVFPGEANSEVRNVRPGEHVTISAFYGSRDERIFEIAVTATGPVVASIYGGPLTFDGDVERTAGGEPLRFQRYEAEE